MMDMMVCRGLPGIELREFEGKKILHGTIAQFFRKVRVVWLNSSHH
jgi:hypothetical protein